MEQAHISRGKCTTGCCETNLYPLRLTLKNSLIYKMKYDHTRRQVTFNYTKRVKSQFQCKTQTLSHILVYISDVKHFTKV
jgi:hypothetical protein